MCARMGPAVPDCFTMFEATCSWAMGGCLAHCQCRSRTAAVQPTSTYITYLPTVYCLLSTVYRILYTVLYTTVIYSLLYSLSILQSTVSRQRDNMYIELYLYMPSLAWTCCCLLFTNDDIIRIQKYHITNNSSTTDINQSIINRSSLNYD